MGHDSTGGSGQGGFKAARRGSGRVGSGQEVLKCRRSGRVGLRGLRISLVGSSQEVCKSRGSGQFMYGSLVGQATMTRGLFLADPRVERADLAYRFAFFKLPGQYGVAKLTLTRPSSAPVKMNCPVRSNLMQYTGLIPWPFAVMRGRMRFPTK